MNGKRKIWYSVLVGLLLSGSDRINSKLEAQIIALTPAETVPTKDVNPTTGPASKGGYTISKATTYITEPLLQDGRPDYVGAINAQASKGVTQENNMVVAILECVGSHSSDAGSVELHHALLEKLGISHEIDSGYLDFGQYCRQNGIDYNNDKQREEEACEARPWDPEEHPDIKTWIDQISPQLDKLLKNAQREHYFYPCVSKDLRTPLLHAVLPSIGTTRWLANHLCLRAMRHLHENKIPEATQELLLVHKIGRMVTSGNTTMEKLVGIAIENKAVKAEAILVDYLSATQLEQLQRKVRQLPLRHGMMQAFSQYERFINLDTMLARRQFGWEVICRDLEESDSADEMGDSHVDWDSVLKEINAYFDRIEKIGTLPTIPQQKAALAELLKEVTDTESKSETSQAMNPRYTATVKVLTPALMQLSNTQAKAEVYFSLLELNIALTRYHIEHHNYPKTLKELTPKYLAVIPRDRFNEQPLQYRLEGKGWVLYSVGANLIDDGGRDLTQEPPGDDIVLTKTK